MEKIDQTSTTRTHSVFGQLYSLMPLHETYLKTDTAYNKAHIILTNSDLLWLTFCEKAVAKKIPGFTKIKDNIKVSLERVKKVENFVKSLAPYLQTAWKQLTHHQIDKYIFIALQGSYHNKDEVCLINDAQSIRWDYSIGSKASLSTLDFKQIILPLMKPLCQTFGMICSFFSTTRQVDLSSYYFNHSKQDATLFVMQVSSSTSL